MTGKRDVESANLWVCVGGVGVHGCDKYNILGCRDFWQICAVANFGKCYVWVNALGGALLGRLVDCHSCCLFWLQLHCGTCCSLCKALLVNNFIEFFKFNLMYFFLIFCCRFDCFFLMLVLMLLVSNLVVIFVLLTF